MKKIALIIFTFLLLPSVIYAQSVWDNFFTIEDKVGVVGQTHSFSIKGGYHFFPSQGFFNEYEFDKSAFNGGILECDYEFGFKRYFGLNIMFGTNFGSKDYNDIKTYTQLDDNGEEYVVSNIVKGPLEIRNYYLAPSLKYYFPKKKWSDKFDKYIYFSPYVGCGAGWYYTDGSWEIESSCSDSCSVTKKSCRDTKDTIGVHILAGLEIYPHKGKDYSNDDSLLKPYGWPVSVFGEARYVWARQKGMGVNLAKCFNDIYGTIDQYKSHDLRIGGFSVTAGIRYYF